MSRQPTRCVASHKTLLISLFKIMFQTNFAKSFKFLKDINVLGEINAC